MIPNQSTTADIDRQDSFRWERGESAKAFDHFNAPDATSQRQYARDHGIPHSTVNYWAHRDLAVADDPSAAFFLSSAGHAFLEGLVLAAFITFSLRGACGLRLLGSFLELAQLGRFVATSVGALQPLTAAIESDLGAFDNEVRPQLAEHMDFKTIAICTDEHFHEVKNCLVAIEPVSGFIVVECYRDHRDADTWTDAIKDGVEGMHVQIVLMNSDLAAGLTCCAEKGLEVMHSPDLFHGQHDLLQPLVLPLTRSITQAEKDLEKARQHVAKVDVPPDQKTTAEQDGAIFGALGAEQAMSERLEEAREHKEEAIKPVRGLGDDYHPFDRQTGRPVTAEQVQERLNKHVDEVEKVVEKAHLGEKAQTAVGKSRTWLVTLAACVAWFWGLARQRVEEMELSEEQEQVVYQCLLAGHYWEMTAGKARDGEEKKRLKDLAEKLQKEAWQEGSVLRELPEEKRKELERATKEIAGLFSRSSSCVEGRNGRLSLHHHGHGRVSERRLKALTVIHNYMVKRPDGTTAAERFFGQKHPDLFSWLLQRLPDLPRPAPKRPKKTAQSPTVAA
jgi:hypothetical protein